MSAATSFQQPIRRVAYLQGAVSGLLVSGLAVASGATVAWLDPSVEVALVGAISLVAVLPLIHRLVTGRLDLFEPIFVASLAFVVMYAARPFAIVAQASTPMFKGLDISNTVPHALWVAFLGVAAFQLGYALPLGRHLVRKTRAHVGDWVPDVTVVYAIGLLTLALLLFGTFIHGAGGMDALKSMLKGRSDSQEFFFRNSSAYLYGAPELVLPAALLLFAVGQSTKNRSLVWIACASTVPVVLFSGARGSRITLLPMLFAPLIYWFFAKGRRPRWIVVVLCGYFLLTVGIAYLRDTRTEQHSRVAELAHSIKNPTAELNALIVDGVDNDMFDSLAAELTVVGSSLAISPVDFATRLVAKPVPSVLWKEKPVDPDEHLNDVLFPNEPTRASSSTGLLGSFYLFGGVAGVLVGMAMVGVALRAVWEYYQRHRSVSVAQMLLAAVLVSIPMLLRGGISDSVARYLFLLVPLGVAVRLCWRRPAVAGSQNRQALHTRARTPLA